MVTAILPTMTEQTSNTQLAFARHDSSTNDDRPLSPSVSSELTITPARNAALTLQDMPPDPSSSSSRLAGFVGMFTGLGALVALFGFLPLPRHFSEVGSSRSEAVAQSFYVVGGVALIAAILCFLGLRNLSSDKGKNLKGIFHLWSQEEYIDENPQKSPPQTYSRLLRQALVLGWTDVDIGLAYVGGFVARASSVGISLFIPLFVNAFFISSGKCPANPDGSLLDPGQIKKNCQRAYIISSILTGMSQLVALICAPFFGYLTSRYRRLNVPLLLGAGAGIAGYISFGLVKTPDPQSMEGNIALYFLVALIGVSQISAIVCSLGLLSRGMQKEVGTSIISNHSTHLLPESTGESEAAPLLRSTLHPTNSTNRNEIPRSELKGSIAGIYSLAGGAGILLLTKVGGLLFDRADPGSPFFMMAGFNVLLLAVGAFCALLNVINVERLYDTNVDSEET
jgi:Major Facilitator Superfamily